VQAAFEKEQADSTFILTSEADSLLSQIFPSSASHVTADVILADNYVLLCDWRGRSPKLSCKCVVQASPTSSQSALTCSM